ncbi:hypothetical protein EYF80_034916 [Liparis tanakae]|uniref:Uncharacterized protein n=1 Tax=Liparis tanakae TaxID=230148 RepID=A0A4Z2GMY9_9TELE|nr:hypothetical protein EYF80_034916 [Liparis tanakae]
MKIICSPDPDSEAWEGIIEHCSAAFSQKSNKLQTGPPGDGPSEDSLFTSATNPGSPPPGTSPANLSTKPAVSSRHFGIDVIPVPGYLKAPKASAPGLRSGPLHVKLHRR